MICYFSILAFISYSRKISFRYQYIKKKIVVLLVNKMVKNIENFFLYRGYSLKIYTYIILYLTYIYIWNILKGRLLQKSLFIRVYSNKK